MGVLKHVHIRWIEVAALLLLVLVSAATEMGLPTLLARMIDGGVAAGAPGVIVGVAVAMAVLSVAGCVASLGSTVLSARISTTLAADLRAKIFRKVQSFSSADMDRFGAAHAGGGSRALQRDGWSRERGALGIRSRYLCAGCAHHARGVAPLQAYAKAPRRAHGARWALRSALQCSICVGAHKKVTCGKLFGEIIDESRCVFGGIA